MTASRPLAPDFDAVPKALQARRQWVLWRLVHRPGAKKPTKVPYRPGGQHASSTDPVTWSSFEDVRAAYRRGGFDGIGYVFSPEDAFTGIDLDGCRDPVSGDVEPWARVIIDRFATYCEISPSGTGVHLIVEGWLPPGGRRRGGIECYDRARYFTITAQGLNDVPVGEVKSRGDELVAWHGEVFSARVGCANPLPSPPESAASEADDDVLLGRARTAKNGAKFRALFDEGNTSAYGSHSEADLALCMLLAFWTRCDAARIDLLFRRSRLLRQKWDRSAGKGETYGQRTVRKAIDLSAPDSGPVELCTDLGNARRLVERHGHDLLYTGALGWLVWDGRRWSCDDTGEAERRAKDAVRSIRDEVRRLTEGGEANAADELWKWALKSQGSARLDAILRLARTEPEIAARGGEFDKDPWLLNVLNGTLDLRTGDLRPHRRDDLLTKLVPVGFDPKAEAPQWRRFLEEVQPDPEARGFLARYAGYCLTGEMGEQVFAVHHGGGSNGKGVYSDMLLAVLGDYAGVTPFATFVQRRPDAPTNDLAALRGARLVVASEPNEGMRLDEGTVKAITGEDPITARYHYKEFSTFYPTCKLVLTGNHRPRIRGTDHAMWRRVLLVPWPVTVTTRNKNLRRHLREELPGILRWAVEGCLAWQREGLCAPRVVRAAVEEYREAEDHVGRFIADRCQLGSDLVISSKDLRSAYGAWAEEDGENVLSAKAFGSRLTTRGLTPVKDVAGLRGRGWRGITVATDATDRHIGGGSPPTRAGANEHFSQQSAEASQLSQPALPACPSCDRGAGGSAGWQGCGECLAAIGEGAP